MTTTEPTPPFWFIQRQAKLEPAGENVYKVTAPNQGAAYILIRPGDNQLWAAAVKDTPEGEDAVATGDEFETPWEAWQAAFELYRLHAVV